MRILPPAPSSVSGRATLFYSEHLTRTVGVAPWSASFRTRAFNRLSMFKLLIIRHVLVGGRDAWFCDVDVVFVRNPWPLFLRARPPRLNRWGRLARPACDYEYAANEHCADTLAVQRADATAEGNTGFHLFVRSDRTMQLLFDTFELALQRPDLDDQTILWQVIRRKLNASTKDGARDASTGELWRPPPSPPSPPNQPPPCQPPPLPPPPPPSPPPRALFDDLLLTAMRRTGLGHFAWRPPPPRGGAGARSPTACCRGART